MSIAIEKSLTAQRQSCGDVCRDRATLAFLPLREIFGRYLRNTPLAYTLFRVHPARAYQTSRSTVMPTKYRWPLLCWGSERSIEISPSIA